jgi:hypothetical protein
MSQSLVKFHAMKTHGEVEIELWMRASGQLHAPAAFSRGKNLWYPLNRRLGGTHTQYGLCKKEKNTFELPGISYEMSGSSSP